MKRTFERFSVIAVLALGFFIAQQNPLFSEEKPLYPGFVPPPQSKAYEQFMMRPQSDLSKLIYLIDRFVDSDVQVMYENHYYPASFAARIARAFLPGHYHNEKPETWVMQWCSTSFPSGSPIWMKFPNETYKLGREVLMKELKLLDDTLAQQSAEKQGFA